LKRTSGRTDYYEVSPAGAHKIEFKIAGGASWVGVSQNNIRGKLIFQQSLKDGETATVDVTGPVYINVAHANVVDVSIDGVLIDDGNKTGGRRMQLDPAAATGTETGTNPSA
jgi:hypothetical protein